MDRLNNCANAILSDVVRHSDEVNKLSQPLKDNFGVSYFYYCRIYNCGKVVFLSNRPNVEEYWIEEKVYLYDPFIKHPSNYNTGFFFTQDFNSGDIKNVRDRFVETFHLNPWVNFIEKNINSFDHFGFWGNPLEEHNLKKVQINHAQIFKSYIPYFKNKTKLIVREVEEHSHSIIHFIGKEAFYENLPVRQTMERDSLRNFLIQIGMGDKVLQFDSLSKREAECLKALIRGKSAKDIALELQLSFRTVEHYLENSRHKLDCYNKRELFSTARELEELGLLK